MLFFNKYQKDVPVLAQYADHDGNLSLTLTYANGNYQVTSPTKIPANILANINNLAKTTLPKSKDPNTKFTTNITWTFSFEE